MNWYSAHLIFFYGYLRKDLKDWENEPYGRLYVSLNTFHEERTREFAHAILMPRDKYKSELQYNINDDGSVNVQNIADYFGVDYNSAKFTGQNLYLLQRDW